MGKSSAALTSITFQTSNKVPLPGGMHMQVHAEPCISEHADFAEGGSSTESILHCPGSWHTAYHTGTKS